MNYKYISIVILFMFNYAYTQIPFSQEKIITDNYDNNTEIGFGDIDNNSLIDIFVSKENNLIRFEKNPITGEFSEIGTIASSSSPYFNLRIIDFDQDGFLDLLYRRDNNKIALKKGIDYSGNFEDELILFNSSSTDLDVADFDQDGDLDILICPTSQFQQISWFENQNAGDTFIENDFTNSIEVERAIVIDINQDGFPDVLSESDNEVRYYQNDGEGSFGNGSDVFSSFFSYSINTYDKPIDIDQDGHLDIVLDTNGSSTGSFSNGLYWFENNGSFFIQNEGNFIEDYYSREFDFIDYDSDGDLDLLHYTFNNGTNCRQIIIEEKINGSIDSFANPIIISEECQEYLSSTLNYLTSHYDLDGDGDKEILGVEKFGDNRVFWLENLSELPSLKGVFFFDDNLNGILDSEETKLSNQSVSIEPGNLFYLITDTSGFIARVYPGDYSVVPNVPQYWDITNSDTSYNVNVTYNEHIDNLDFGLFPNLSIDSIETSITSAPTRCGFEVPFHIDYFNNGTNTSNGMISFKVDDSCNLVSFSIPPDSAANNTYFWFYENLSPLQGGNINAIIEMPGVESIGDSVTFVSKSYYDTDQNELIQSDLNLYTSQINCAYDPNDKLVVPSGVGDDHQTLIGSNFEYTIRFQNTGTDTAFNVLVTDTIDINLDLSSLKIISSSHACDIIVNNSSREVKFNFENILLPDSLTDEINSHGFIKYKIDHHPLEENSVILNTANIFFDFNPPIVTNTTQNTMVFLVSNNHEVYSNLSKINVYPNPTGYRLNFNTSLEISSIQLYSSTGQLVKNTNIQSRSTNFITVNELQNGIYFYVIKDANSKELQTGKILVFK